MVDRSDRRLLLRVNLARGAVMAAMAGAILTGEVGVVVVHLILFAKRDR